MTRILAPPGESPGESPVAARPGPERTSVTRRPVRPVDADVGKIAVPLVDVEAVADDEVGRDGETDIAEIDLPAPVA